MSKSLIRKIFILVFTSLTILLSTSFASDVISHGLEEEAKANFNKAMKAYISSIKDQKEKMVLQEKYDDGQLEEVFSCWQKNPQILSTGSKIILKLYEDLVLFNNELSEAELSTVRASTQSRGPGWVVGDGGDDDHILGIEEIRRTHSLFGI